MTERAKCPSSDTDCVPCELCFGESSWRSASSARCPARATSGISLLSLLFTVSPCVGPVWSLRDPPIAASRPPSPSRSLRRASCRVTTHRPSLRFQLLIGTRARSWPGRVSPSGHGRNPLLLRLELASALVLARRSVQGRVSPASLQAQASAPSLSPNCERQSPQRPPGASSSSSCGLHATALVSFLFLRPERVCSTFVVFSVSLHLLVTHSFPKRVPTAPGAGHRPAAAVEAGAEPLGSVLLPLRLWSFRLPSPAFSSDRLLPWVSPSCKSRMWPELVL